jgi:hypothetical protein
LRSRLAARLAHGGVSGCILTASVYPKLKYLNSSYGMLALVEWSVQIHSPLRLVLPGSTLFCDGRPHSLPSNHSDISSSFAH